MTNNIRVLVQIVIFFAALTLVALYFENMGYVITCIVAIIVLCIGMLWELRER